MKTLVIIDGKSVFYRGYYAMGNLSTAEGVPTSGVYGFATIAMEIVKKLNIDAFVVGDDWNGKYDYLKDLGVQVFYFPYGTGVSSTKIKETIHDSYAKTLNEERQHKPKSVQNM
mgnify:CR=1 FL=1